jgi:2-dehydro-3-deoxygalactonokinase
MPPPATLTGRHFLSCDWGTTSLRLALIDASTLAARAQVDSSQGIAAMFSTWRAAGLGPEARWGYYYGAIRQQIAALEKKLEAPLAEVPLVVSGMASSSMGMVELPYKVAPFATDGSDLGVRTFKAGGGLDREVALVSGVRTDNDVMRGEEVQLVGAVAAIAADAAQAADADDAPAADDGEVSGERVFILPGTHSKHIVVSGNRATSFQTFMTGEFFSFLARSSVLAEMVEADAAWGGDTAAFDEGVREGASENLLHACFRVRVRGLQRTATRAQNSHYLSGLLIGSELGRFRDHAFAELVIVAAPGFSARYRQALETLGVSGRISSRGLEEALTRGHGRIAAGLGWLG